MRVFDAGVGDGTVLARVLRSMHDRMPTVPFYVVGKEISLEDVRLALEKTPDRFCEHPATVLVMTNMYYSEAPWLHPRSLAGASGLEWHELALKGSSAAQFDRQIADLQPFLAEKWTARPSPTGGLAYERPVVLVIYREDHKLLLDAVRPKQGAVRADFDLVIASQPYRARAPVEFKANKVIAPLARALGPGGRLIGFHSYGHDPGLEIIHSVWPGENPFLTDRHELLKATKQALGADARGLNFNTYADKRSIYALPDAHPAFGDLIVDRHLDADGGMERRGLRGADRRPAPRRGDGQPALPRGDPRGAAEARPAVVPERVVRDLAQPLRALSEGGGDAGLRAAVARLMRGWSVEQTPAEMARRSAFPAAMPKGTRVYLTWVAGAPFARSVAAAARVRELGMVPVPHLAARAIADPRRSSGCSRELQREAGVEDLLLIAGSQDAPAGSLADRLQLLATRVVSTARPWRSLGFAAHPEGAPAIDAYALSQALAAKERACRGDVAAASPGDAVRLRRRAAARVGASVAHARRAAAGPGRPRRPRLARRPCCAMPRTAAWRLRRACLLRHGGRALRTSGAAPPGRVVAAVARAYARRSRTHAFSGFHFYPFGSLEATVGWAAAVAAGLVRARRRRRDLVV